MGPHSDQQQPSANTIGSHDYDSRRTLNHDTFAIALLTRPIAFVTDFYEVGISACPQLTHTHI